MKQFISILTLSIFIPSCRQNENKQKELKLNKKKLNINSAKDSNIVEKKDNIALGTDSLFQERGDRFEKQLKGKMRKETNNNRFNSDEFVGFQD